MLELAGGVVAAEDMMHHLLERLRGYGGRPRSEEPIRLSRGSLHTLMTVPPPTSKGPVPRNHPSIPLEGLPPYDRFTHMVSMVMNPHQTEWRSRVARIGGQRIAHPIVKALTEDPKMAIYISAHFGVIHSMFVHFPIAFLILAFFIDVLGILFGPQPDRFFDRAGFWVLTLALLSLFGALITGKAASAFTPHTASVNSLIRRHELDAFTTTSLAILAWLTQALTKFDPRRAQIEDAWTWAGTGRGRLTIWSGFLVAATVVLMLFTANHGGDLVHRYKL